MILSILITTLPEREIMFHALRQCIYQQVHDCLAIGKIEILDDDSGRGVITTGEKRNRLLQLATGKYFWFVDDDDMVLPGAIEAILNTDHDYRRKK